MAMTAGGKGGVKSEINVTPLVDVVLVLLIIFMVVTPMLQRGKDVQLPRSIAVDKEAKGDPLILSVTKDGKVWVEKDQFDGDGLLKKLQDEVAADPYKPFLLKGDSGATVGDVRKVMAIARKAGARGVRVAVEQVKTEGQG